MPLKNASSDHQQQSKMKDQPEVNSFSHLLTRLPFIKTVFAHKRNRTVQGEPSSSSSGTQHETTATQGRTMLPSWWSRHVTAPRKQFSSRFGMAGDVSSRESESSDVSAVPVQENIPTTSDINGSANLVTSQIHGRGAEDHSPSGLFQRTFHRFASRGGHVVQPPENEAMNSFLPSNFDIRLPDLTFQVPLLNPICYLSNSWLGSMPLPPPNLYNVMTAPFNPLLVNPYLMALNYNQHMNMVFPNSSLLHQMSLELAPKESQSNNQAQQAAAAPAVKPPISSTNRIGDTSASSSQTTPPQNNSLNDDFISQLPPNGQEITQEMLDFVTAFIDHRSSIGFSRGDVSIVLTRKYGRGFSTATIGSFETADMSYNRMCQIIPVLKRWMESDQSGQTFHIVNFKVGPDGRIRRNHSRIGITVRAALEKKFTESKYPTVDEVNHLANTLNLKKHVIRTWFKARRQKENTKN